MQRKKVELVHVGTELLAYKVNTHTVHLARLLAPLGLSISRAVLVRDELDDLARAIAEAWARADLVLVTGGLGPTFDDLTREAAGRVFKRRLVYKAAIAGRIRRRYLRFHKAMPENNKRQAMILAGAKILTNDVGTAPGQMIVAGEKALVLLPGPSREMENTLAKVLPYLKKKFAGRPLHTKTFHIAGHPESKVEEMASSLIDRLSKEGAQATILASPYVIDLTFHASNAAVLTGIRERIQEIFGQDFFGEDEETLESKVGELLWRRRQTLALAESCTGGFIADKLTNVAGSSRYFLQGFVAYSNEAKRNSLGVAPELISRHGAVSAAVALAMAEGARRRAPSDWAVSVTGICGPSGGTPDKPVGLGFFGLAGPKRATINIRRIFYGNRLMIKERMAYFALDLLRRRLLR